MTNCPLCHSKKIEQFQPIPTSNRGAKIVQKIEYAFCHRCSIIFNSTIFKNRGQYKKLFFKTIQKELFIENNSKVELHNRLFSYLEIFKKIPSSEINSILDIGCRDGRFLNEISLMLQTKKNIGVDFKTFRDFENIEYLEGDFLEIPFINKFSLITSTHVIEHLLEPYLFFKKLDSLLTENGYLFLSFPDAFYEFSNNVLGTELLNIDHKLHFSLEAVKYLCNHFGYKIIYSQNSNYKSGYKYSVSLDVLLKKSQNTRYKIENGALKNGLERYIATYRSYFEYAKNLSKNGKLYLYGGGEAGKLFKNLFENFGINIESTIDDANTGEDTISFETFKTIDHEKTTYIFVAVLKKESFEKITQKIFEANLPNIKIVDLFWGIPFYV